MFDSWFKVKIILGDGHYFPEILCRFCLLILWRFCLDIPSEYKPPNDRGFTFGSSTNAFMTSIPATTVDGIANIENVSSFEKQGSF